MVPYNPVKVLMLKTYSDESLIDVESDIWDAISESGIPQDENGFRPGTYTVEITWKDDEQ